MYSRRLYWFKAMLLLSGQFAEILDVDRGVRKPCRNLQRAAQCFDITSQIADINVGALLQLCEAGSARSKLLYDLTDDEIATKLPVQLRHLPDAAVAA